MESSEEKQRLYLYGAACAVYTVSEGGLALSVYTDTIIARSMQEAREVFTKYLKKTYPNQDYSINIRMIDGITFAFEGKKHQIQLVELKTVEVQQIVVSEEEIA